MTRSCRGHFISLRPNWRCSWVPELKLSQFLVHMENYDFRHFGRPFFYMPYLLMMRISTRYGGPLSWQTHRKYWSQVVRKTIRSLREIQLTMFEKYSIWMMMILTRYPLSSLSWPTHPFVSSVDYKGIRAGRTKARIYWTFSNKEHPHPCQQALYKETKMIRAPSKDNYEGEQ